MSKFTLTTGQEQALDSILLWLHDPRSQCYVLEGFAGTGKTYLVERLLTAVKSHNELAHTLGMRRWEPVLTATTNAAAYVLSTPNGDAVTIHKHLGLRVHTDYKTDSSYLVQSRNKADPKKELIIVDEASYIDKKLLSKILEIGSKCKFLFIGDPCQLPPVSNSSDVPVFSAGFPTSKLDQVVRQDPNNPIYQLSLGLRKHVLGDDLPPMDCIDGELEYVSGSVFKDMMEKEFTRSDWKDSDSKFLSWTNQSAVGANNFINTKRVGRTQLMVGDTAVNNHSLPNTKADQLVYIRYMDPESTLLDVCGRYVSLDTGSYFLPNDHRDIDKTAAKQLELGNYENVKSIRENWIDLRSAYACTINKSQGSTYDTVFLDLSTLGQCRDLSLKARLFYVAVSRAKKRVVMTGSY